MFNGTSTVPNTAIGLVSNIGRLFPDEESTFLETKVDVDLLQDERKISGKFGCSCSYGVKMHSEQTNRDSSLYI